MREKRIVRILGGVAIVVAAVKPGDVRFKVVMNVDQLTRPVEETESTHLYE